MSAALERGPATVVSIHGYCLRNSVATFASGSCGLHAPRPKIVVSARAEPQRIGAAE